MRRWSARSTARSSAPSSVPDPRLRSPTMLARARSHVASSGGLPGDEELSRYAREGGTVLGSDDRAWWGEHIRAGLAGAGPLQPLLDEPGVTDVLVNGPREVWVDSGAGLSRADVDLGTPADVRALAVRLAALGGRRLDEARPTADATLPDGTRLHAVLPPLSPAGTVLSLRVLRPVVADLAALRRSGGIDAMTSTLLAGLVSGRANILVSGATGAGKTTLLAVLLAMVGDAERIVCVEEVAELAPAHPHLVRLVAREANVEGSGAIGLAELVRHALRMRPDRLVVGECRGAEVREVLTALNTGHAGACATLHANGIAEVPARLAAMGALADMSPQAVGLQARGAVDAVVHVARSGALRYVAAVGAVVPDEGLLGFRVEPVLRRGPDGVTDVQEGWPAFARRWRIGGPHEG